MIEAPRVVTRALLVRAAVRALPAVALGLAAGARPALALHALAALGGATALERAALERSRRRSSSPSRCAAEALLLCAGLHAAVLANGVWSLSGPGLDLHAKAEAVGGFLERAGPATTLLLLLGSACALAGPSSVRARHERAGQHALTNGDLPWLLAAALPLTGGLALLELDDRPLSMALGAAPGLVGLGAIVVVILTRLDRLAGRVAPGPAA